MTLIEFGLMLGVASLALSAFGIVIVKLVEHERKGSARHPAE